MTFKKTKSLCALCVFFITLKAVTKFSNTSEKYSFASRGLAKEQIGSRSVIENAQWCQNPISERDNDKLLPFKNCNRNSRIFRLDIFGGMTSYLNKILKVAIWAFEEDACFYIDEEAGTDWSKPAKLGYRKPEENTIIPFLDRYFEHMGISKEQYEDMVKANKILSKWSPDEKDKVFSPTIYEINKHAFGSDRSQLTEKNDEVRHRLKSLEKISYVNIDNIVLKKLFLRRLFRIKPHILNNSCKILSDRNLDNEYIALSVRRGDKITETELVETVDPYIEKAEIAIQTHFAGVPPTFYVATDDCSVMQEFQEARPNWNFVGECNSVTEELGFVFKEMWFWDIEQTDSHFEKFITEMIAMASAKYFIGVSTTNVSYWIYFMRHVNAHDDSFVFVDTTEAIW